ncbi:MAG: metallophosphoesterase family protein [Christensenellales bacterium]|jgi:3',5'-cyclic AMP phosphodiesterase CpdA
MKLSVKAIAIIIIAGIIAIYSAGMVTYFVTRAELDITVISDTHMLCEEQIGDYKSPAYLKFDGGGQKMKHISEAIIKTAIDEFINSRSEILMVAGDLTDDGSRMSHLAIAKEFQRAEDAGKRVYVINGNHDVRRFSRDLSGDETVRIDNVTPEEFKQIYYNFGYDESISEDDDTLSYAVNLNRKYRLICFDSAYYDDNEGLGYCTEGQNSPNMTKELTDWCVNEIEKAVKDNMIPIAMTHIPLLQHLGDFLGATSFTDSAVVQNSIEIAEKFAEAGLKYVFTGHMHAQDIVVKEYDKKKIYDIETGSLTSYPFPMRNVKFNGERANISTQSLDNINEDYLPEYLLEEERNAIITDFYSYKLDFMKKDLLLSLDSKVKREMLASILDTLVEGDGDKKEDLITDLKNLIFDVVNTPLYKTGEGLSIEGICLEYGVTLQKSEYKSVLDLVTRLYREHSGGDENIKPDAVELTLLKYTIYSVFYMLDDFGLFDRLSEIDNSVSAPDLAGSLDKLFTQGRLDILNNNLIASLLSFKIIADILPFEIGGSVFVLLTVADTYLKQNLITGVDFSPYLDADNGELLLGDLLDRLVFDSVGGQLLIDAYPPDNKAKLK